MIRVNKIGLATLFFVGILLVSCGTIEPKPTQKPIEKETVAKPIEFSFEKLPEYDEITDSQPLINSLIINIPANTATESVDCKISFADKTLWSKTVKVDSTEKEQKIRIEVDPYQPPEYKNLPAQYTVTGLSNNNFKNQIIVEIKSDAQLKVSKFLPELKKNSKLKHVFTNKYIVSAIDENDQLNYYIYDAIISEAQQKTVFTLVTSYDCKGFVFINNLSNSIAYRAAKTWIYYESYYFAKDGKYYKASQHHPFSGYLDNYSESEESGPKIYYDVNQKPVRENPYPGTPLSMLSKHSENDKEIIFRTEYEKQINIIFDKEKKVFTKEEYVD